MIWIIVGQGLTVLAVGSMECLEILSLTCYVSFSFFVSPGDGLI